MAEKSPLCDWCGKRHISVWCPQRVREDNDDYYIDENGRVNY